MEIKLTIRRHLFLIHRVFRCYNKIVIKEGFTLIELRIVVAIIGILAGTVVVSLSGETDSAQDASTRLGVSALRPPAISEQFKTTHTGVGLCDAVFLKVRNASNISEKWSSGNTCDLTAEVNGLSTGEICCHSNANEWIIFGKLSGDGNLYCIDHAGAIHDGTDNVVDLTERECD